MTTIAKAITAGTVALGTAAAGLESAPKVTWPMLVIAGCGVVAAFFGTWLVPNSPSGK